MPGPPSRQLTAGIIGRTLRLMLAILLLWMTYIAMRTDDAAFNLRVVWVFAGLIVFYTIVHLVISKFFVDRLNPWLGAALALTPVVVVFVAGGPLGRVASVAFIGVSLLLQVIRGDAGCEVMAIPSLLFRKHTHLVCLFFSPIDWVEKHLTGPGGLPG